jgi:hypothetical protein
MALTANQIAAGGPIPPNYTLASQEAECAAELENPPWYRTVIPAAIIFFRLYAYAPSYYFDGPLCMCPVPRVLHRHNDVYAYQSSDVYETPFNLATRGIDEMYIYGGGTGDATPPALQTYVSRLELGILDEVWRTYLNNANITDELHLSGAVDLLADGCIGAAADHSLYKINATTGGVEAVVDLPSGIDTSPNTDLKRFGKLFCSNTHLEQYIEARQKKLGLTNNGDDNDEKDYSEKYLVVNIFLFHDQYLLKVFSDDNRRKRHDLTLSLL